MQKSLFLFFLLISLSSLGQRVANFSFGEYGSKDFESYSFWVSGNKRANIDYSYVTKSGQSRDLKLTYLGTDYLNGEIGFKVKFPNNLILYVIPKQGGNLRISSLDGTYNKYFNWLYEGPVDGKGTFCEPCAENENDAIKILKLYFLR